VRAGLRLLLAVAAGCTVFPLLAGPAAAGEGSDGQGVDRVLVLSLPTVSWDELDDHDLPHLEGLFEGAAIADLSVRGTQRFTDAGEGYLTIGAGARAAGPAAGLPFVAGTDDTGVGASFQVDELVEGDGDPAGEVFERRTGAAPPAAGVVNVVGPALQDRNDALPYDAEVGALAEALTGAGVERAVVANADRTDAGPVYDRTAALALADADGAVPGGMVADDLLERDASSPGGVRLDEDAVVEAFGEAWGAEQAVVLVEASDLVRVDALKPETTLGQTEQQRAAALEATDQMVGRLLEQVDPERDAVLVVGPWHRNPAPHLTVAALRAPGVEPGLLESASTRRAGFVTLVDVGPTVLDLMGIDPPSAMEGTPFERAAGGGSYEDRVEMLAGEDEASRFRDGLVAPVAVAYVLVQLLLWVVAALALRRSRWWLARQTAWAALASLVFLASTYWAGLLPFHQWGAPAYVAFLVVVSTAIGYTLPALLRRQPIDPLIGALSIVLGTLVVDIVLLGDRMQLSTTFGYSPTVGGRFAGLGNLAFAQLAASTIILAGLVAHRIRATGGTERRAVLAAGALVAMAVVVDGAPMWGSDVGGVLALLPGGALTVYLLQGRRFRVRAVVAVGLAAVAAVLAFGALDLLRPEESRTHLGRLLQRVGEEGIGAFTTVAGRKLGANFDVLGRSVWTLMVPIAAAFVVYLWWRAPRLLQRIQHTLPERDAIIAGFAVTAVLGFALNDSGIAVPGVMLGVLNSALVFELCLASGLRGGLGSPKAPAEPASELDLSDPVPG
jgi:hypothetical protein